MGLCFAPDCDHTNKTGCKMFKFPKDPKLKQKWENLIRRGDRTANKFSLICSCHFESGDKNNLPTLFKHRKSQQFNFPSPEKKRRTVSKKDKSNESSKATSPSSASNLEPSSSLSRPCSSTGTAPTTFSPNKRSPMEAQERETPKVSQKEKSVGSSSVPTTSIPELESSSRPSSANTERDTISSNDERSSSQCSFISTSSVEAENYFLRQEVENLRKQLEGLSLAFSFKHIESNNRLIMLYTGLPDKIIFDSVFEYLNSQKFKYYLGWSVVKISRQDQFFITLMKLRQNLLYEDLALRFNCSVATITNIFITWVHLMHICLFQKFMRGNVPSREKNRTCLPGAFASFTNCKMVIDCTEVYTAVPRQLDKQQRTYSSYKHRNTLKGLVGVAPNGTITYLSDLYVGNTSDKKIVKNCGLLTHFKAGDLILADKGFLISDILPPGVSLNIPPFLNKSQFSPEEVKQTLLIAKGRIHVERAIARIKNFKILSYIPASLRPYSSIIFQVCGFLTTLNYPLIKEVEELYGNQE